MVLILGAKGMLGGALRKVFPGSLAWDREEADVTKTVNLRLKIENLKIKPNAVINCVAFNDVDGAEEKRDIVMKLNSEAPGELAKMCRELDIAFVHFSTNYVFDGEVGEYGEADQPNPLSIYGESKYQGELEVQKNTDQYYLIRSSVLFGPKGESELSKKSFIDIMLELSRKTNALGQSSPDSSGSGQAIPIPQIKAVRDEINSLTYAHDLAQYVKMILEQKVPFGTYHIINSGQASWYDFAKEIFAVTGKQVNLVPVSSSEFPRKARRPKKAVLINTKLPPLRPWQEALAEYLNKEVRSMN